MAEKQNIFEQLASDKKKIKNEIISCLEKHGAHNLTEEVLLQEEIKGKFAQFGLVSFITEMYIEVCEEMLKE